MNNKTASLPKTLVAQIKDAQNKFHFTGETVEYSFEHVSEVKGVTTITLATRDMVRGLSYTITQEKISIAKGSQEKYLGYTHPWSRDEVKLVVI